MHLRHLHLNPLGLTSYAYACHLQSLAVSVHLSHKAQSPELRKSQPPPEPVLITFQSYPTYTCGRRETQTLTDDRILYLRNGGKAEFYPSQRGGLTTFHGPGQLTAFLVSSLDVHGLRSAQYVHFLEEVTIQTCQSYGIAAFRTQNPGVWVNDRRKITSLGVHLRRYVSSFGVGLNVETDLSWFRRIVACGLDGVETTTLMDEAEKILVRSGKVAEPEKERILDPARCEVERASRIFADKVANGLAHVESVATTDEIEIREIEKAMGWKGMKWDEMDRTSIELA